MSEFPQQMIRQDDGLFTYEYLSESGGYRIEGLTFADGFNLCDELDEAGGQQESWEAVLRRWADGYRCTGGCV